MDLDVNFQHSWESTHEIIKYFLFILINHTFINFLIYLNRLNKWFLYFFRILIFI